MIEPELTFNWIKAIVNKRPILKVSNVVENPNGNTEYHLTDGENEIIASKISLNLSVGSIIQIEEYANVNSFSFKGVIIPTIEILELKVLKVSQGDDEVKTITDNLDDMNISASSSSDMNMSATSGRTKRRKTVVQILKQDNFERRETEARICGTFETNNILNVEINDNKNSCTVKCDNGDLNNKIRELYGGNNRKKFIFSLSRKNAGDIMIVGVEEKI